jgi:hypothetical protein
MLLRQQLNYFWIISDNNNFLFLYFSFFIRINPFNY